MSEQRFEDALHRLEEIVSKMEEGNIDLDMSLKYYEEGIKLVQFCSEKLKNVEQKIKVLREKEGGEFIEEDFFQGEKNG